MYGGIMNEPRIYVADLAAYNAGHLRGRWIDVPEDATELHGSIQNMLGHAEEWAIHDYENFGAFRLSEYESLETVCLMAEGLRRHGKAFSVWATHIGETITEDSYSSFEDVFVGEISRREFTEDYADNVMDIPEHILPYFDYESLERDLFIDAYFEDGGYIFVNA